jgi:DNA-binding CsgD family transcriptional regulator
MPTLSRQEQKAMTQGAKPAESMMNEETPSEANAGEFELMARASLGAFAIRNRSGPSIVTDGSCVHDRIRDQPRIVTLIDLRSSASSPQGSSNDAIPSSDQRLALDRMRQAVVILANSHYDVHLLDRSLLAIKMATDLVLILSGPDEPCEFSNVRAVTLRSSEVDSLFKGLPDERSTKGTISSLRGGYENSKSGSGAASSYDGGPAGFRREASERHRAARLDIDTLSPRERTVLGLIGDGKTNKEIARTLQISPETVKAHVKNLFLKLGVEKRAQAVARTHKLDLRGTTRSTASTLDRRALALA